MLKLLTKRYSEGILKLYSNTFKGYEWYWISQYQNLSESFIEKYKDKVCWSNVSRCQKLSLSFVKNNINRINFRGMCKYNDKISKETKAFAIQMVVKQNQFLKFLNISF
jgi:hypothetical protein